MSGEKWDLGDYGALAVMIALALLFFAATDDGGGAPPDCDPGMSTRGGYVGGDC